MVLDQVNSGKEICMWLVEAFPFIYLSTSDAKLKDSNLYYTCSLRAILALVLIIHKNGEYGVA